MLHPPAVVTRNPVRCARHRQGDVLDNRHSSLLTDPTAELLRVRKSVYDRHDGGQPGRHDHSRLPVRYETVLGTVGFDANGDSTQQMISFYRVDPEAADGAGDWVLMKQQDFGPPQ